ncbi:hypothetical protein D043_0274A, partial [Vibrio parahaemolyticus EKP-021]
MPDRHHPY